MKNSKTFLLLLSIFGILFMISCRKTESSKPENALARVGNTYLTADEAASSLPGFLLEQDSTGALKKYRDNWVQRQLLLQEAERLDLTSNKSVQRKLQKAREEVLRNALKNYVLEKNRKELTVTDEEARNFYQANKSQFRLDEEFVQFRHMKARTLKDARAAKKDLMAGISWPEVARKYAMEPENAIESSEQFWPISMALSDNDIMSRYLNIIGQQEISPIQRVNGAYQFVQLMDSRAKGEMPELDWLIEKIKEWMILNRQQQNFQSYIQNLYLKAESNNEVETFNVIETDTNSNNTTVDTLQSNIPDE